MEMANANVNQWIFPETNRFFYMKDSKQITKTYSFSWDEQVFTIIIIIFFFFFFRETSKIIGKRDIWTIGKT